MRFLFIAHRIPYPPNKGDKIRSFHELKFIATLGEVYLAALVDDPADFQYEKELRTICHDVLLAPVNPKIKRLLSIFGLLSRTPMSVKYFYEKRLQLAIDKLLAEKQFDGIFCFSSTSAEYIFRSSHDLFDKTKVKTKLVMDFCDVDSYKWSDYSLLQKWPFSFLFKQESSLLKKYEHRIERSFDHSILISSRELALYEKVHPGINSIVEMGNGVDLEFFKPQCLEAQQKKSSENFEIIFTGAMDYYVNIEGVLWFVDEIWPLIKKQCPQAVFTIVGSKPAPEIMRLKGKDDIDVTGFVDDIRLYYARAAVCVAPLRIARGIQNKILEALAMAKAVVCTPNAFEGINAAPGQDLLVHDSAEQFASAVAGLLKDLPARKKLEENSRKCVEKFYHWDANLSLLENLLSPQSKK